MKEDDNMRNEKYYKVLDELNSSIDVYNKCVSEYELMLCDLKPNSTLYKIYELMIGRTNAKIEALETFRKRIMHI